MTDPIKLKSVQKYTAEVFYFRFEPFGWLTLVVCEVTGGVSISSDRGSAGYDWNPGNTGLTGDDRMKRFLATANPHYIWHKFGYENPRLREQVIDEEKTKANLIEIARDVEAHNPDLLEEIIDEIHGLDYGLKPEAFLDWMPEEVRDVLCDAPWGYIETVDSHYSKYWRDQIIPFVQEYLREQGYGEQ